MVEDYKEREIRLISKNRRAYHDYIIAQVYEAGIVLQGTEVKSLRNGKVSLQDAYAGFQYKNDEEIYIFNLHINQYDHGNRYNHEPKRPRKLLLNLREIRKLKAQVAEKGMTIIPLSIYFSGPYVKVELGLAKPKRKYDKRESNKKKETDREIRRKFRI